MLSHSGAEILSNFGKDITPEQVKNVYKIELCENKELFDDMQLDILAFRSEKEFKWSYLNQ
jgi:hypothetical protein